MTAHAAKSAKKSVLCIARSGNRRRKHARVARRSPTQIFFVLRLDSRLVYRIRRDSRSRMSGLYGVRDNAICCGVKIDAAPTEIEEIGMTAKRIERPAAALSVAVSLTATIAAFAIGHARAQTVNPVPPPPPPVVNPSGPSTVPQTPEVPVSPAPPSGLSSSPPAPVTPDVTQPPVATPPPAVAPQTAPPALPPAITPSTPTTPPTPPAVTPQAAQPPPTPPAIQPPVVTPPPAVTPQATTPPAAEEPASSRTHARYHRPIRRRFHAVRAMGPSYYPGLVANPCHFRRVWQGYYAPYWTYTCSW